jgi:hypothetical protein
VTIDTLAARPTGIAAARQFGEENDAPVGSGCVTGASPRPSAPIRQMS